MGSRPKVSSRALTVVQPEAVALKAKQNGEKGRRPAKNLVVVPARQPVVRLTSVSKSFGKIAVLKGVDFSVGAGELVEVTGPSGSGKTTLLRLLHGQMRPSSGEIWVGGRGLHRRWRRGVERVRQEVAFIFQEQRLLPRLTALENLVLALQMRDPQVPIATIKQRARAALESVTLSSKQQAYPHQLSAGERQRVGIARALAMRPRILLADEPLSSLDETNAEIVTRLLLEAAAAGTAVVVATHKHAFPATRILRLPSAKVMTNGSRQPVVVTRNGGSNGRAIGNGNGHAIALANGHGPAAANGGSNGNGAHRATGLWQRVLAPVGVAALVPTRERRTARIADKPMVGLPLWRRCAALAANAYRMVVLNGLRSWSRDVRVTMPVLGTIALLLVLCGSMALVGVSLQRVAADQAAQASLVRVYLSAGASPDQVAALRSKLEADPRVASVTYVSPEQALAEARSRPGLDNLASLSSTNPFPASLDVRVRLVTKVAAVAGSVNRDPAVDPTYPTSYDPDTYSRLRQFALVVGAIGGGLLLLFIVVAYAVVANSMRGVAAGRRNEVGIGRLLGARGWMLRGPFVVEGLMTGAIAGALAAALVAGFWLLATRFEASTFAQVLPGVGATSVQYVMAALIVSGLLLGAGTALLGFRRVHA